VGLREDVRNYIFLFFIYNRMKSKKIVFSFGRFNPPTTGHLLLATKVKQEASRRGADYIIYGSNSQDPAKNPLNSRQKLRFMKKVLKGFNVDINSGIKNPYDVLSKLDKDGYTDVVMVVGADRVNEFKRGMKKYIGPNKLYKFQNFEVISAGERDPDADDVTGMSASKMRAVAKEGNIAAFKLGVPQHVSTNDIGAFFKAVQTGMKIKPFIAESWFDYDEFVEFLEENDLKKFDMSGVGIDIPAVDNKVWGTEGIKKSAKKKKVELDETSLAKQSRSLGARQFRNQYGNSTGVKDSQEMRSEKEKKAEDRVAKRIKKLGGFQLKPNAKGLEGGAGAMSPHIWDFVKAHTEAGYKGEAEKQGYKIEGIEHEENELNELTIQARRKMAMSAKRSAKRRARKRKIKEKRKKSGAEIKKKAQKAAISKIRGKMIKGMNWNDLSYSQREKIGERLKKKKGAIQKLAKRLLPATVKAEK
jgi:hypothetical protein